MMLLCAWECLRRQLSLQHRHICAALAARLTERLFLRWIPSRWVAWAEPESPAWRRMGDRPTSGDESAAFLQLIGAGGCFKGRLIGARSSRGRLRSRASDHGAGVCAPSLPPSLPDVLQLDGREAHRETR